MDSYSAVNPFFLGGWGALRKIFDFTYLHLNTGSKNCCSESWRTSQRGRKVKKRRGKEKKGRTATEGRRKKKTRRSEKPSRRRGKETTSGDSRKETESKWRKEKNWRRKKENRGREEKGWRRNSSKESWGIKKKSWGGKESKRKSIRRGKASKSWAGWWSYVVLYNVSMFSDCIGTLSLEYQWGTVTAVLLLLGHNET